MSESSYADEVHVVKEHFSTNRPATVLACSQTSDFRDGMAAYRHPVLIVATSCGPLGASFQREHVAAVFRTARVVELGERCRSPRS